MWISVKDELKPRVDKDGHSKPYPIKVKGFKGWTTGSYFESKLGSRWIAHFIHGDYEVTDWYDLPQPPEGDDDE